MSISGRAFPSVSSISASDRRERLVASPDFHESNSEYVIGVFANAAELAASKTADESILIFILISRRTTTAYRGY